MSIEVKYNVYQGVVLSSLLCDAENMHGLYSVSEEALAKSLGLIIPPSQSVSSQVVQSKMCFAPVRVGYVTEVN